MVKDYNAILAFIIIMEKRNIRFALLYYLYLTSLRQGVIGVEVH